MTRPAATLLLPGRQRFGGQALPAPLAGALGRADPLPAGDAGTRAQLQRHFTLLPNGWPVAALTRTVDAGDADSANWLRADPAWIRPDINGARLLAVGEGMALAADDAETLLPALRTLFGDAGFPIDAPVPSRWYLRLPPGAPLPPFAPPEQALGTDLGDVLLDTPAGDANARRWRSLLSEAQVVLHNHPWNARRAERGLAPVNSLWFWGGGALPDQVTTTSVAVRSDEALLRALATRAGVPLSAVGRGFDTPAAGDVLVDLRGMPDMAALASSWLVPALAALQAGQLGRLRLDFADGAGVVLERGQRWRFWRRPLAGLSRLPPLQQ
ncbi:MAG TPA: phosphoglycerate mutase [Luteimonas sp.]|nr:phosphoglycerate mutase [Luteimonas sp.]